MVEPVVKARPRNTKTRILVAALVLLNRQGEPNTTTNDIANEADVSPGNLHYHFRKKADLIDALLAEFQADARRVLQVDDLNQFVLDDFWLRLHLLLEFTTTYRFMFRDTEALIDAYPGVARALRGFARGLTAAFEVQLRALVESGMLKIDSAEAAVISRNFVVLALFSTRYDALTDSSQATDIAALRTARAILAALRPYASPESVKYVDQLSDRYER